MGSGEANLESESEWSGKPMPHFICVPLTHISSQTWEVLMCTGYCLLVKAGSHGTMDNVSSFRWKILGVSASRY